MTLATIQGTSRTRHFLDGSYTFGPQASASARATFWDTYRHSLNQDVPRSTVESTQGNFNVAEDVYAGYAMATLDAGSLRLIPGVRVENTRQENTGNLVKQAGTNVDGHAADDDQELHRTRSRRSARAGRSTIARPCAARSTTSLVRPAFGSMTPFVTIPDGNDVVASIGNPDLKPTRALNLDFQVERYFRSVGFVSAGVFHKKLDDFIFCRAALGASPRDNYGPTVITVAQPVNGATGTLDGYELAWQQNLTFLPERPVGPGRERELHAHVVVDDAAEPRRHEVASAGSGGQCGERRTVLRVLAGSRSAVGTTSPISISRSSARRRRRTSTWRRADSST